MWLLLRRVGGGRGSSKDKFRDAAVFRVKRGRESSVKFVNKGGEATAEGM